MISKFDTKTLNTMRAELNEILTAYGKKNNVVFDLGRISFNHEKFSVKMEASIPNAKGEVEDPLLAVVMRTMSLKKEGVGGRTLVKYNSRAKAYPFIFAHNGKQFKCSEIHAKMYFSAK